MISALAFLETVRGRDYNFGPDVREFYEKHGSSPLVEAQRFMLAQLTKSMDVNSDLLPGKARAFRIGFGPYCLRRAAAG